MLVLQLLCGNLSRFFDTPHARRLRMTSGNAINPLSAE